MTAKQPTHATAAEQLRRVVAFYETLRPETLPAIATLYHPDAHFKDPFNEVTGVAAIRAIFAHMFATLEAPRFVVDAQLADGDQAFLTWRFFFRFRGEQRERQIRGCTHLSFAPDGRVVLHRDYWDAAEELYEQLPLIGPLMRWLRRRLATPTPPAEGAN